MFDVSLFVEFDVPVLVDGEQCQPTWDQLSQVLQVSLNSLYRRGRIIHAHGYRHCMHACRVVIEYYL